jgi:F0F1-type ATP synthase delta subunit
MSTRLSRRQLAQYAADELMAGVSTEKIARQLAAVLANSKRAHESELLARDIAWELERRGKIASANITSVTPLSESLRNNLAIFIKDAAKVDEVNLQETIDKSVLGGVKIETAIHSWDKTVATKLRNIREASNATH